MYNTFSLIEGKHRLLLWNHINLRAKAVYMEQRGTHFSCGRTVKENETRYEMKNILAYVLTHVSKHIMRPTFQQPSKMTREQWPIRNDFDKSPLELSAHSPDSWKFTGTYPPLMLIDSRTVRKYFHVSPQMETICDWHISAHQNASPERKAFKQNKHLTFKPPPTPFKES